MRRWLIVAALLLAPSGLAPFGLAPFGLATPALAGPQDAWTIDPRASSLTFMATQTPMDYAGKQP